MLHENSWQLNCMHIFTIFVNIHGKLMHIFTICCKTEFLHFTRQVAHCPYLL